MAPEVIVEAGGALLDGVEARQHLGLDLQLVVVVLLLLPRLRPRPFQQHQLG